MLDRSRGLLFTTKGVSSTCMPSPLHFCPRILLLVIVACARVRMMARSRADVSAHEFCDAIAEVLAAKYCQVPWIRPVPCSWHNRVYGPCVQQRSVVGREGVYTQCGKVCVPEMSWTEQRCSFCKNIRYPGRFGSGSV